MLTPEQKKYEESLTKSFDGGGYGDTMNFSTHLVLSMLTPEKRQQYIQKLKEDDPKAFEEYVGWCQFMEELTAKDSKDNTKYYY